MRPVSSIDSSVSLIMCTRNRAARLGATLDSIERLTGNHLLEIVLVDNGSTDRTSAVLEAYRQRSHRTVILVHEPRPGLSNARNAGIRAAKGAILAFTDDDCYPDPLFIETIARIFRNSDVDFIGGPLILHDPADHWVSTTRNTARRSFPAGTFILPGEISGGCMAFRRTVFDSAGLFDPELGPGTRFVIDDAEMAARACLCGHPAGFFPEAIVHHHHRRKRAEGEALAKTFAYGRGALWAKLLVRERSHRAMLLKHCSS